MNDLSTLWGKGEIRAFISHKAENKRRATKIKERLIYHGIAGFVAHRDIEALSEWVLEMERALFSMHVLVALLTEDFSDSNWTDQEVGVAIGRKVPIIPVKLGRDPYGFIGKFQAISPGYRNNRDIADLIKDAILKHHCIPRTLKDAVERFPTNERIDRFILDMSYSRSFSESNDLANQLNTIQGLSPEQEEEFVQVYNGNDQIYKAFEFQDRIVSLLTRWTGNSYELKDNRLIRVR